MPVYAIDKPLGLTSHDVVARARRLLGTRRVGHSGTLDPLASGVLVLCAEDSTKLVQFMERDRKDYLAWVSLGASTPTLDAEGPIAQQTDMRDWFETYREGESAGKLRETLRAFVGEQKQVPPQYSALQVGGVRAYAVARAGGTIDLPARDITIHELELLGLYPSLEAAPRTFDPQNWRPAAAGLSFTLPPALGHFPTLLLRARVGSGTYLRSLARDIGAALGLPAHLAGLVRTRAGQFTLTQAQPLSNLKLEHGLSDLSALSLPRLEVDARVAQQLRQGKRPPSPLKGRAVALRGEELVAVVDGDGQALRVVRAWA